MNTCIIHHLKKIVSIHKYHLKKKCVHQKNNVLGVVDLFESEIFTANFRNQVYSFAEWTSLKYTHCEELQPNLPGEKSGPLFWLKKKNWFDSGKLADCFFQAGELHQVSHLMCWRWTSVAKNNHWSILPVPWVFVGHFWNPFGGCPLTSSQPQILKGQWFDSRQILKGSQNFWTNYPFWKKLCDGTSRLHQFFEKDKISFQTTKT